MKAKVTIESGQNETQELAVRPGLGFQAICAQHATPIEFSCREADCGVCAFRVVAGGEHLSAPNSRESDFLKAMRADPDERLACQTRVMGDVHIAVGYL